MLASFSYQITQLVYIINASLKIMPAVKNVLSELKTICCRYSNTSMKQNHTGVYRKVRIISSFSHGTKPVACLKTIDSCGHFLRMPFILRTTHQMPQIILRRNLTSRFHATEILTRYFQRRKKLLISTFEVLLSGI